MSTFYSEFLSPSFPVISGLPAFSLAARVSPLATLLLAIDGPAAAAKVCEQRRRRRQRPRLEKGGIFPGRFHGASDLMLFEWDLNGI